jgi:hypothetical protein
MYFRVDIVTTAYRSIDHYIFFFRLLFDPCLINLPDSVKEYLRIRLMRSIEMILNTQLLV